ncbi:MAG TPA: questin oxidase family protein [Thermoanaerobaculia bacterium]|nr:questin oxidase family protein [Thermoanaerobaculia bacterium]
MVSEACRQLLLESQRFSAKFDEGFFNHLPMALVALDRLGGDEARLRAFAATYSRHLLPKTQEEIALREQFREIPQLDAGVESQAFHCLIRLAYAVDSGVAEEIPDAMSAWMWTASTASTGRGAQRAPVEAFTAIANDDRFPRTIDGRSISGRIAKVMALPAFREYACAGPLEDLALISAKVYASTGDFTALHMLTGCHAMRILAPHLGPDALGIFATALLAAYVIIGRPPIVECDVRNLPSDEALAARAITSDDDHDLKLVYSALQEEAEYKSGYHRLAAAVRLNLP